MTAASGGGSGEGWRRHPAEYERHVLAFFGRHLLDRGAGLPAGEFTWPEPVAAG